MSINSNISLQSPKLQIVLGNPDDSETWRTETVQTIGRDVVAAETLFGVQKIGRPIDHPVRSLSAMAYYALVRTGKYSGPFEAFEAEYLEVAPISVDTAFPTEAGPAPA